MFQSTGLGFNMERLTFYILKLSFHYIFKVLTANKWQLANNVTLILLDDNDDVVYIDSWFITVMS
jgi:hypothetical protein